MFIQGGLKQAVSNIRIVELQKGLLLSSIAWENKEIAFACNRTFNDWTNKEGEISVQCVSWGDEHMEEYQPSTIN